MKKNSIFFAFIILITVNVYPHYQWIVDQPELSGKKNITVFMIGCGHVFPESEILLKKEMITKVQLRRSNTVKSLKVLRNKKFWKGIVESPDGLPVVIEYKLKKKISASHFFQGRAVLYSPDFRRRDPILFTGEGMEIVPQDLYLKKKSDYLYFKTFLNGDPVPAKLIVIPEGKKPSYLYPDSRDLFKVKLRYTGRYLVYTFYKGKGASITFSIVQ